MKQFESGYGDYTLEREAKLKDITLDEIVMNIKQRKGKTNSEQEKIEKVKS